MEAIERFALGTSSVEEFARHVQIKSALINEFATTTRCVATATITPNVDHDAESLTLNSSFEPVRQLIDTIEAMFLHGLRAKLSLTRMWTPVKFGTGSSWSSSASPLECITRRLPDFWPVLLILSHNQVSEELRSLHHVRTDVGRCRAWIRLALNESLFLSYFDTLIGDTSLLHGFYRPYAFVRDKEQTSRLRKMLVTLIDCSFRLELNFESLNLWSVSALRLLDIPVPIDPHRHSSSSEVTDDSVVIESNEDDENDHLKPIMPAVDALTMLPSNESRSIGSSKACKVKAKLRTSTSTIRQVASNAQSRPINSSPTSSLKASSTLKKTASGNSLQSRLDGWSSSPVEISNSASIMATGSAIDQSDRSVSTATPIPINRNRSSIGNSRPENCNRSSRSIDPDSSYKSLLNSYSKSAVLSTTPDVHDIHFRDIRLKLNITEQTESLSFNSVDILTPPPLKKSKSRGYKRSES
jgi:hypothetical protein